MQGLEERERERERLLRALRMRLDASSLVAAQLLTEVPGDHSLPPLPPFNPDPTRRTHDPGATPRDLLLPGRLATVPAWPLDSLVTDQNRTRSFPVKNRMLTII